ncbi:helix-turn-helix domain-containing protein [Streptomyces andamanensis]|uniref:Helix-turn-helix domain-containing protein n=1 Tax=Streptomyces andamanensis TaxID=1565035 RepID=A0ABV8TMS8_9ACTN
MWQGGSTGAVPAGDRFAWFSDVVSSALMPSAFSAPDTTGFYAEGALLDLGGAQVSRFTYSPLRSRRTPALIRRGDPEQYQLGLVTRGSAWFAQNGAEAELRPGDMALWDTSRPYESGSGADGGTVEVFVLQIPKAAMPLRAERLERLLAHRIPGGRGLPGVLSDFLTSLTGNGPDCRPEDLSGLGGMAVELAATCLAQQAGAVREMSEEARAEALFRRVDAFIENHLGHPDLTPRAIAEHHHISLRTLYALFQDRQEGVAASIRRRRLERCRADLSRPELRDTSVQTICARWGFTSPTVFSRTFRGVYGMTPSEYRHRARIEGTAADLLL